MSTLRATIKLVLFVLHMLVLFAALRIGFLVRRDPSRRAVWRHACFRTWCRGALRILSVRLQVDGPCPARPFLLVGNHLGYLDIPVLGAVTGGRFVAKRDVSSWPGLGPIIAGTDTLFVDRENHRDLPRVNQAITSAVAAGDGVIVFPEGTSSDGASVLPFRPSLLDAAARERAPVHGASLAYRTPPGQPPASTSVCWWGDMTFADHFFRLLRLPCIDCTVRFGARPVTDGDRKELARRLRQLVIDGFTPTRVEEEIRCPSHTDSPA